LKIANDSCDKQPHQKIFIIPTKVRGYFRFKGGYFIGKNSMYMAPIPSDEFLFFSKHDKKPKPIKGLDGMYSLKRLSELH